MLTHDLLMVAGAALLALSVLLALIAVAQSRAPVNAARALVAGLAAIAFAAFWNPQPFALTDVPQAVGRVLAASGLDRATEVPGAVDAPAPEAPAAQPAETPTEAPAVSPAMPPAVQENPADGARLPSPPGSN